MQGCKDGRLVIPKRLQESKAIAWYHHYMQHPGHIRLTLKSSDVLDYDVSHLSGRMQAV